MNQQGFSVRINGIIGFIFLVLMLVVLFFIAKGIFTLLAWLSPALIIGALLIHYQTVTGYLKFMWSLLKRNPAGGILAVVLSVVGFPVLSGILFGKAMLDRKVKKLQRAYQVQEQAEYVEYEEVIRPEDEESLDLPPMELPPREKKENRYEDLF